MGLSAPRDHKEKSDGRLLREMWRSTFFRYGFLLSLRRAVCGCGFTAGGCTSASSRSLPPAAYAPAAVVYAAPPPQKSGGALKVILIIIAVVVGLGVIGVGVAGYLGYRALHKAGAAFSAGSGAAVSNADLGVDPYPGADTQWTRDRCAMNLAGNLVVSAMYTTSDSTSDVVSFYQGKLANATTSQSGNSTTLTSATVDGSLKDAVVITVTPSGQGGTQMVIVHTKTSKP